VPYYYRARYYTSSFGRFISEDPIGIKGGLNEYAYAGSSPTNFKDPSGEDYVVSQSSDGSITISAPIALYGGGADLNTAQYWQHGIMTAWNGHQWRGCNVFVAAPVYVDRDIDNLTGRNWVNYVYVVQGDYFRSNVQDLLLVPVT